MAGARLEKETAEQHAEALRQEQAFAREVIATTGATLTPIETRHFIIWTNLTIPQRQNLGNLCEAMYGKLQRIFQVPADEPVFLGKCSVFLLANREQFKTFSQVTHDVPVQTARQAAGFLVVASDGRTRIVGYWPGNQQELAEVLVHEGAHAFLYRYRRTYAVDLWLNEGLAEHVVALTFRNRCDEGRSAIQHAARVVRRDPQALGRLMALRDGLPAEYYPLAQSVVAFLVQADGDAFVRLVHALKDGESFEGALQQAYSADLAQLDARWRQWVVQVAQAGRPIY